MEKKLKNLLNGNFYKIFTIMMLVFVIIGSYSAASIVYESKLAKKNLEIMRMHIEIKQREDSLNDAAILIEKQNQVIQELIQRLNIIRQSEFATWIMKILVILVLVSFLAAIISTAAVGLSVLFEKDYFLNKIKKLFNLK